MSDQMDCANYLFLSVFYKHVCFYPLFIFFYCPMVHYHTNVAFISNSPRYLVALFVRVSFLVPVKASPEYFWVVLEAPSEAKLL